MENNNRKTTITYTLANEESIEIEVSVEVAESILEFDRLEAAYLRRLFRYKAHYSLDQGDGIEHDALYLVHTPQQIFENELDKQQLYTALASLPDKQAERIYAHYFLGMSKAEIARAEGVAERTVGQTIERGLRSMKIFLRNMS